MHRCVPAVVLLITLIVLTPAAAQPSDEPLCFPRVPTISDCIEGRFASFWNNTGGLPVFGYPITSQLDELNPDLQNTFKTQWFERNRFELHPTNPAP
jgi:hypothetical protein